MKGNDRKPGFRTVHARVVPRRTPSGFRKRRDRAAKQRALIAAALDLFASKGYESTTTREIAAAAGCAEGLIHRYFKGKAGLLPALAEGRTLLEVKDLHDHLLPTNNFEQEFLQLVAWEVDLTWQTRDYYRVFIARAMVDPSISSLLNRSVHSARIKTIKQRLKRYPLSRNLPAAELEVLAQSVGMLGLVFGFMRPVVLGQDRDLAKEMARTFAKILVSGVHLRPRR